MTPAIAASGRGRPLRFLMIVMLCWAGGRIATTQDWTTPQVIPAVLPVMQARAPVRTVAAIVPGAVRRIAITMPAPVPVVVRAREGGGAGVPVPGYRLLDYLRFSVGYAQRPHGLKIGGGRDALADIPGRGMAVSESRAGPLPGTAFAPSVPGGGRLSGTAWLFWRDAGGSVITPGAGQLGGAQAGARIAYQLLPGQPDRLTLYARATSALRRPFAREGAFGVALQPVARLPVHLTVERRADFGDGGRNALAAGIVGGIGPAPIVGPVTIEAYGQAGVVGMKRRDAYVDGKLSVMHPLPGVRPVTAGFALSGGAQPQVARLDIGPQIEARLRLGDSPARISAEWRERIAGKARPGSGLAITLAADF